MAFADFGPVSESGVGARNGQERVEYGSERPILAVGEVRRLPQKPPTTRRNRRDQARKNPNRERLGFRYWWSWAELNRRPQAFFAQFYMCSRLFWVSPDATRSDTLCTQPATLNLTAEQVARPTASLCKFPRSQDSLATTLTQPMGQLLRGSPD